MTTGVVLTFRILGLFEERDRHLESVVRPAAELHLAVLVVEGEPGDVDGAGREEDAGGDVGAEPVGGDYHVGRVGAVKSLAGTEREANISI